MTDTDSQKAYEIKSGRTAKREHSIVLNKVSDILNIKEL
jgi:hypothetical protein